MVFHAISYNHDAGASRAPPLVFSDELATDIPDLLKNVPPFLLVRQADTVLPDKFRQGYVSIKVSRPGGSDGPRYPLWAIRYWIRAHVQYERLQVWDKAIEFGQVCLDAARQKKDATLEDCEEALGQVMCSAFSGPLFGTLNKFELTTDNLAKILSADSWLSYTHLHACLLNIKARYPREHANTWVAHSDFEASVLDAFKEGANSSVNSRLVATARWLRAVVGRRIAALIHANGNHWACLLIHDDGRIIVADSKSVNCLPSWWIRSKASWRLFMHLVNPKVRMSGHVGVFGKQSDSSNCGVAAMMTIRHWLDPTAPLWTQQDANMWRLKAFMDVSHCSTVCASALYPYCRLGLVTYRIPRPSSRMRATSPCLFLPGLSEWQIRLRRHLPIWSVVSLVYRQVKSRQMRSKCY
jgi:hypothetical protein